MTLARLVQKHHGGGALFCLLCLQTWKLRISSSLRSSMGWRGHRQEWGRPTRKVATTPGCSGSSGHKGSVEREIQALIMMLTDNCASCLCRKPIRRVCRLMQLAAHRADIQHGIGVLSQALSAPTTRDQREAEGDGALSRTHEGGGVAPQAEREGRQARGAGDG